MLRLRPHSATGSVTEFLPATLEIQESPPSPVGRAVAWTIMAVFAMAVLWASLSYHRYCGGGPGQDYSE